MSDGFSRTRAGEARARREPAAGERAPHRMAAARRESWRRGLPVSPWLLAGVLAAIAVAVTFDAKLYVNGDNVEYMFLARSVRHGALWPSDKYPPLFPLLLAPIQALFGLRLVPQKLLVLAFSFGSVWMLSRIFRRRLGSGRAAPSSDLAGGPQVGTRTWGGGGAGPWILFIAATLVPLVEYAHYVMSEIPYLFFLLGAIDACDRLLLGPRRGLVGFWRDRLLWTLALWVAAAFYTRSAGGALGAACILALVLAGRRGEAAGLAILSVLLGLPWAIHSLAAGGNPYFRQLLQVNPYYPEFGYLTPAWLWRRIRENVVFYCFKEAPSTVLPLFYASTYSAPGQSYFPSWIGAIVGLPLLAGLVQGIRRRDPAAAVVVLTFLLCFAWPLIWSGNRFLVPAVPLLLLFWWRGWSLPAGRAWGRVRRVLLVVLLLLSARNLVFYKLETEQYPPVWAHYFSALDWIRENTPEGSIVVDRKPGFVEYVARRSATSFPRETDPDRMLQAFRASRADYVVLPSIPYDDIGRYLKPALDQRRQFFRVVFQVRDPYTYVLRFQPGEAPRTP